MNIGSRTIYSLKNMIVGIGCQIILLILSFISRTIFIKTLGAEFLGLNSLYLNILSVLSLVDLGFGSAISYSLYRPLAEGDKSKLSALINFYKKTYFYVALVVGVLGISLVPFLHFIVKMDSPIPNLELYFLLFLSNSIMSYLFIYKSSIIIADQRMYLIKIYSFAFDVVKFVLQIIILIFTQNYILYLIIQLVCTLLNNLFISHKSNKLYPFIKNPDSQLSKTERKEIYENMKSMLMYRFAGVALNNTNNILISSIVGTVWVGFYSNYLLIVGTVQTFTDILYSSLTASIGNLNTNKDPIIQERIFRILNFSVFWISGFSSICFFILLDDFIVLWLGKDLSLGFSIVIAIVLNFYIPGMMRSVVLFRDTTELFKQTKYVIVITAIVNLILAIILGKLFGLAGILYATVFSRILTNVWYEPMILYKVYFKKSPKAYFVKQFQYILLVVIISGIMLFLTSSFHNVTVVSFCYKLAFCLIIPNVLFALLFHRTEEFKYLLNKFNKIITFKKEVA